MLNGQTFSSRTGKTSGLPKFELKILPIELLRSSLKRVLREMRADSFIIVDKDASDILLNYQYPGNYREMEGILRGAMRLAINNNRNEILSEDTNLMISKSQRFWQTPEPSEAESPFRGKEDLSNIKLKDIIDYADRKRASIIETKISETLRSGKNLLSVLQSEGLSEKEYQYFLKKVKTITEKKIKELY